MTGPITAEMIAPELREALAKFPKLPMRSAWFRRLLPYLLKLRRTAKLPGVAIEVRKAAPATRIYRPHVVRSKGALLWIHGGGYIIGGAVTDDALCGAIARELGIVVVSAEYRLAPRNPYPAALDDCHVVWSWLSSQADVLGIEPGRVAVGGMSAGGGLAAALVQRIHDEGAVQPVAQMLMAPMLDDRTAAREELDALAHPVWDNGLNRFGWRSYLGVEPGAADLPAYASPGRREDLADLPPAWIGLGSIELFHEEDAAYARRLAAAGVEVAFEVVPGAPHGFEAWGQHTAMSRAHIAKAITWLGERVG